MASALTITIDTELDNEWTPGAPRTDGNLERLPEIQERLRALGARPTFLVSYGAVTSAKGERIVSELGRSGECEIGAHLHPWETPPLTPREKGRCARHEFPHRLESPVLRQKLGCLTEAIAWTIGRQPVSYRAGRWGMDGRGIALLEEFGYLVDTSVSPLICWHAGNCPGSDRDGPCFRRAPVHPYFPGRCDIAQSGETSMLEVPVSIRLNRGAGALHALYSGLPSRHLIARGLRRCGIVKPVWMRPTYSSSTQMIWLARTLLGEGVPVLNMMFHSSELAVGTSPYVCSQRGLARMWERIETTVRHLLHEMRVVPLTLSEFRAHWVGQQSREAARRSSGAGARRPAC
jgi:hypothetical protein